jgi:hypothetical protein
MRTIDGRAGRAAFRVKKLAHHRPRGRLSDREGRRQGSDRSSQPKSHVTLSKVRPDGARKVRSNFATTVS